MIAATTRIETTAPAAQRQGYAARQALLLDALLGGATHAEAAAIALRRGRANAAARACPELVLSLGDSFEELFDGFARTIDLPRSGDPLEDGLAFARSLGIDMQAGGAGAELLPARAGQRRRCRLGLGRGLRRRAC